MIQTDFPRLLGDIGGTNARFAWQAHAAAQPSEVVAYACADHASLLLAMRHYLEMHDKPQPVACAIGIANPILGDRVQMTNHHWSFSISELQSAVGLQRLIVIDDFTALDLSLPALTRADLRQIGGGVAVEGTPMAVLGPGTGLGVSGLFCVGAQAGFLPVNGEGGHVSLSPADDQEAAVIRRLQIRFGHASAERALSGPGLVNLYEAACSMASAAADRLAPSDVLERAVSSSERHCTTALELFCSFLGGVAGNLALTLGARGGVYIGGGIAPRIVGEIERSMFRARFEAKGRFADYLAGIPTFVIDAQMSPALLGAAKALDQVDKAGR
jgi:glucokinase